MLVVDDDRDIREMVTLLLGEVGYIVRDAMNGSEALGMLATWRSDVILLDLMTPVMDGLAFLSRRREASRPGGHPRGRHVGQQKPRGSRRDLRRG